MEYLEHGRWAPRRMRRLDAVAKRYGPHATYGELAEAIEPGRTSRGKATFQGLVVRRREEVDLRAGLMSRTPVRIH
jgi:hypothetical protein